MTALTQQYWPAVYAFLRGKGLNPTDAGEVTQDFFVQVVLGRDLFERADRAKGRLRNLILKSLQNYRRDGDRREKVRGAGRTISLEQIEREEGRLAGSISGDVEVLFERRWALGLLEEAYRRCEQHFRQVGKEGHWMIFLAHQLRPALTGGRRPSLSDICEAAGFDTPSQAASASREVRHRVQVLLPEVVAETLDDPSDLEEELENVRQLLQGTAGKVV